MPVSTLALTSAGAIAVGLILLRRWRSSKWGVCTLKTKLNGKVVIVTGGNVGLGAEAAMDFAKRGATVILAGSSQGSLEQSPAQQITSNVPQYQ